jgi:hypothetical protein
MDEGEWSPSLPPVLIGQEAAWGPGPVWTLWRKRKLPPLTGMKLRSLGLVGHSLVAISTEQKAFRKWKGLFCNTCSVSTRNTIQKDDCDISILA